MAVIVCKRVKIGESEVQLRTYQPPGLISKEDRLRADKLDRALRERLPTIAKQIVKQVEQQNEPVRYWHLFGRKLREIVHNGEFVVREDVNSGLIWQAVWQHLPESLRPSGAASQEDYSEVQHKRKDHLSLCYEISGFEWPDVQWIRRWDDWNQLAFRPGLLRDPRILRTLGHEVSELQEYPSRMKFRKILKILAEEFPTRRYKDSSLFEDSQVLQAVRKAIATVDE